MNQTILFRYDNDQYFINNWIRLTYFKILPIEIIDIIWKFIHKLYMIDITPINLVYQYSNICLLKNVVINNCPPCPIELTNKGFEISYHISNNKEIEYNLNKNFFELVLYEKSKYNKKLNIDQFYNYCSKYGIFYNVTKKTREWLTYNEFNLNEINNIQYILIQIYYTGDIDREIGNDLR